MVLDKLLAILRGDEPLKSTADDFRAMLDTAQGMVLEASAVYWGKEVTPQELTALYDRDVRIHSRQRSIRMNVIAHLTGPDASDVPYCLLMMSLVKDVERLGDYAKNLTRIHGNTGLEPSDLPDDELVGELREIARCVERLAAAAPDVYESVDRQKAEELTREGRATAARCNELITKISASDYSSAVAVDLTLATRFYKRLQGHVLNLLSSLLMPLHKLDYYDEQSVLEY